MKTGGRTGTWGRMILAGALFMALGSTVRAEPFYLTAEKGGQKYGPFEFRDGEKVLIGKQSYVLVKKDKPRIEGGEAEKKLKALIIPEVEFRQALLSDVVAFLQKTTVDLDKASPEGKQGVNIILNVNGMPSDKLPAITFTARYISVLEAIKIVTQVAGLSYRFDDSTLYIEAAKAPAQP
jgi:hypothetical protein